jgi:opacity protein-like surface antigen
MDRRIDSAANLLNHGFPYMFTKFISVAALSLATVGAAHAEGLYAGALLTRTTVSLDGRGDANPTTIGAKLGMSINKNFAVEARLGTGLSDDSLSGISVKVDNFAGIYAKGILPVSDAASVYGLLGYTQGKIKLEAAGQSLSDSDTDISYGIGADFAVSGGTSVGVEWARFFKGDGYKVDGLSLSVSFKF